MGILNKITGRKEDDNQVVLESSPQQYNDTIALKAVEELLDHKKIKTITRVKTEQVSVISKLYLFSKVFNAPFCKDLADNILQLQISINGLGRRELVQLVQQRNGTIQEQVMTSKDIFR